MTRTTSPQREWVKAQLRPFYIWWKHRQIRPGDVMLASYPRSGNTWLRFLLFECVSGQSADFSTINRGDSIFPEWRKISSPPAILPNAGRLVKTHLTYRHNYQKAIYLIRDPRSVAISLYHFEQAQGRAFADFDEYLDRFLDGSIYPHDRWEWHVQSWLSAAQNGQVELFLLKYEDMLQDPVAHLHKLLDFLQLPQFAPNISRAVHNNSFANMRQNENQTMPEFQKAGTPFVRKGTSNEWASTLTAVQRQKIETRLAPILRTFKYRTGSFPHA